MPVDGQEVASAVCFFDDDGYFISFVEEGEVEVLETGCCAVTVVCAIGAGCAGGLNTDVSVAEEFEDESGEGRGVSGI